MDVKRNIKDYLDSFVIGDKDYPVFKFCKENNIDCSWDFDNLYQWTEIYINSKQLMQFQSTTTKEQFLEAIRILNLPKEEQGEALDKIPGEEFWFVMEDNFLFNEFMKKHGQLFNIGG